MPTNFEPNRLKPKPDIVQNLKIKYHHESPQMWEIIHIRANLRGNVSLTQV